MPCRYGAPQTKSFSRFTATPTSALTEADGAERITEHSPNRRWKPDTECMFRYAIGKEVTMNTPVVLITGALTGIARATALAYARKGAKIIAAGRKPEAGAALVAELIAAGGEAEFVRADVRHEEDV